MANRARDDDGVRAAGVGRAKDLPFDLDGGLRPGHVQDPAAAIRLAAPPCRFRPQRGDEAIHDLRIFGIVKLHHLAWPDKQAAVVTGDAQPL